MRGVAGEVMERLKVQHEGALLPFLEERLPGWKKSTLKDRLRGGAVEVNGEVATRRDHRLAPGDIVEVRDAARAPRPLAARFGLKILYEDEHFVVVDKPAGLLSVATEGEAERTVLRQVREALERGRRRAGRVWAVHRIDRGTSGLLLVARSPEVQRAFRDRWREVEKTYLALVEGAPEPPEGTLRMRLREGRDLKVYVDERSPDARDAVTHYRTLERRGDRALLEVRLETGRKHQIRVHLSSIGHPIVGDERYGAAPIPLKRPALHAHRLRFKHPVTGAPLTLESPLPPELAALLGASGGPA